MSTNTQKDSVNGGRDCSHATDAGPEGGPKPIDHTCMIQNSMSTWTCFVLNGSLQRRFQRSIETTHRLYKKNMQILTYQACTVYSTPGDALLILSNPVNYDTGC